MSENDSLTLLNSTKEQTKTTEKRLVEGIKIFLTKKKIKRDNLGMNNIRISLKRKNKG